MYQVLYHKGCNDGYFAAAAVHFFSRAQESAVYTPIYHDSTKSLEALKPLISDNPHLEGFLFVDIAPSPELAAELIKAGYKVYVVDHHKSARDDMMKLHQNDCDIMFNENLKVIIYDKLSGAALAYVLATHALANSHLNIFDFIGSLPICPLQIDQDVLTNFLAYSHIGEEKFGLDQLSPLYRLIAIRDLWITTDPEEKQTADQLNAWFFFNKIYTNEDFNKLSDSLKSAIISPTSGNHYLNTMIEEGMMIMTVFLRQTRDDVGHARVTKYNYKGETLTVYIGNFVHVSLAGQMVRDLNPGQPTILIKPIIDFKQPLKLNISFRSNGVVCRTLAEQLGGGGHDMAAGAIVNLAKTDTVEYTVECLDKLIQNAIDKNLF